MERNEITTAGSLQVGARFYKLGSDKVVYEMVSTDPRPKNALHNFKTQCVPASIMDLPHLSDRAKLSQHVTIWSNVKVVFLRDADPQSQEYNRQKLEHYHK